MPKNKIRLVLVEYVMFVCAAMFSICFAVSWSVCNISASISIRAGMPWRSIVLVMSHLRICSCFHIFSSVYRMFACVLHSEFLHALYMWYFHPAALLKLQYLE